MNAIAIGTAQERETDLTREEHAVYIRRRVLDTLLREDVRSCVSAAEVISPAALPARLRPYEQAACAWLKLTHLGNGRLWIPVRSASFMQDWRSTDGPLLCEEEGRVRELLTLHDILARFSSDLPEAQVALFHAFAEECEVALAHREISEAERERWFAALRRTGASASSLAWDSSLLHYDRLGAFLDHPFYPTARAKIGFDARALAAYGPEFQHSFSLHWLAVPRDIYQSSIPGDAGWPDAWPTCEDVGLPAGMAGTHALVPVHPFVWEGQLDTLLHENGLAERTVRAPGAWLKVAPTLSVRTVVLLDSPAWHLKLPLTIRTLGAKNIRTIKPSTIRDGHLIQTVLGTLAAREPSIGARLLLTHEECGAHVDNRNFLGYILRRYPEDELRDSALIPVASLAATAASGELVFKEAAEQFYDGDVEAFFDDYLDLTLRLHLRLWLRYGIALESNQQNSVVVLSRTAPRLRLLLKDNDAARINLDYLRQRMPDLASALDGLQDRRIVVDEQLPLAQMFTTITLQLNIAALAERIAPMLGQPPAKLHAKVQLRIRDVLHELAREGDDTTLASRLLLVEDRLYVKYLLVAATLAEKMETGAVDINKFYGRSAPNFLKPA